MITLVLSGADYDCVKKCRNKADGDYQSCKGCHVYLSCSNGIAYDSRPCPIDDVWDDNFKDCRPTSPTCYSKYSKTRDPVLLTRYGTTTSRTVGQRPPRAIVSTGIVRLETLSY